jgi:hypothetical protein
VRQRSVRQQDLYSVSSEAAKPEIKYASTMKALGAADMDFLIGLLGQIANAGSQGRKLDPMGTDFMISVIKGFSREIRLKRCLQAKWLPCTWRA